MKLAIFGGTGKAGQHLIQQTIDEGHEVVTLAHTPSQGTLVVGYVGDTHSRISRADMAAFMLKQLNDDQYLKKSPAVSN